MRYRGVLLDFYGTLVSEDDDVVAEICEDIVLTANKPVTVNEIATFWWKQFSRSTQTSFGVSFRNQRSIALKSLSETIRAYDSSLSPEDTIERQYAQWIAPALLPDTTRFLDKLEEMGIRCCIISNIDRSDLQQALDHNGLAFNNIVASDDIRAYKPNEVIFSAALERLGLNSNEVLHIGDSRTSDVIGAVQAGIPVAWINRTSKSELSTHLPTYNVQSLDELQSELCWR